MKTKQIRQYSHPFSIEISSETDTIIIKNSFGNIDIYCDSSPNKVTGEAILNSYKDQNEILDFKTTKSTLILNRKIVENETLNLKLTIPDNMQVQIYNSTGKVKLENSNKSIVVNLNCGTIMLRNLNSKIQIKLHIGKAILNNIKSPNCNVSVNIGEILLDKNQVNLENSDFNIDIGNINYIT